MDNPAHTAHADTALVGAGALDALMAVLRPLARLAIDHGVQLAQLEELLKRALLEAAQQTAAAEGFGPAPVSRLSVITGIHRKDVKRLAGQPASAPQRTGPTHAAALFTRWLADPAWRGADGAPLALPRRSGADGAPSFEQLARGITTDVHPRTLLDELLRLGLVEVDADTDRVRLHGDAFVPARRIEELLAFAGANVGDHLSAAHANIAAGLRAARGAADAGAQGPFVEQSLFADALSAESAVAASEQARAFWTSLLRTMAPELQRLEDADRAAGRAADHRVRIGLYCYTAPLPTPPGDAMPDDPRQS